MDIVYQKLVLNANQMLKYILICPEPKPNRMYKSINVKESLNPLLKTSFDMIFNKYISENSFIKESFKKFTKKAYFFILISEFIKDDFQYYTFTICFGRVWVVI